MEGHAKKCAERYCELPKLLNNFTKYQLHALMNINSKQKNKNSWNNCQMNALKLSCNVYNLALWGIQLNNADLGRFQDSDIAGDLDSKSTLGGTLCVFGSHTFVPTSWMCKKQTFVSHSSTKSEIISLDEGLRMGGIPALDHWDLIIDVMHSDSNHKQRDKQARRNPSRCEAFKKQLNSQIKAPVFSGTS